MSFEFLLFSCKLSVVGTEMDFISVSVSAAKFVNWNFLLFCKKWKIGVPNLCDTP